MKVYIHSRREMDIVELRSAFKAGRIGDPGPYGLDNAEAKGLAVTYSRDRPVTKLSIYLFKKLGFDFLHFLDNRKRIFEADVVWTMLEWEWMSVALAQRLKIVPKVPIVANSVWLAENWRKIGRKKRLFYRWLMMPHMELTVHSEGALSYLGRVLPGTPFRLSKFGISNNAFPLVSPILRNTADRPIRIYAIGNDSTRDWQIMLDAFGNHPRFHVTIVCKWFNVSLAEQYGNLDVPAADTVGAQRAMYDLADVVVVPMKDNTFSGITVLLEAAARGKPIVASATGGIETYFGEDEIALVPPGDALSLRNSILTTSDEQRLALAKAAQARFINDGYTAEAMVDRYIESSERLFKKKRSFGRNNNR